jgi:hypothetical protein
MTCPYSTALLDGCAASAGGSYAEPTFFTGYAQQSGQTWASNRPNWNVAGVDYPVGPPPTTRFKDPATDPLPPTCSYNATGNSNGGPLVSCSHAVNPDFENFDFSATKIGSHGVVLVTLSGGVTGTVTFNDCVFALDNNTTTDGTPVIISASGTFYPNLIYTNNIVNGNALSITNGPMNGIGLAISIGNAMNVRMQYNAFINIPSRIFGAALTNGGSFQFDHNLIDGWMMSHSGVHGEIAAPLPANGLIPLNAYQYNTILIPATTEGFYTAPFYISNGGITGTVVVTDTKIDHNVIVGNIAPSSNPYPNAAPISVALASFDYNNYGSAEINNNYVDTTGSLIGVLHCGYGSIVQGGVGALIVHTTFANPISYANNVVMNSTGAFSMITPATALTSGGTGYAVNDLVHFVDPGGNPAQTITVKSVNSGVIATYTLTAAAPFVTGISTQLSTSGSGTGATFGPSCTGF